MKVVKWWLFGNFINITSYEGSCKTLTILTIFTTLWRYFQLFPDYCCNAFTVETDYQSVAVNSTCRSQTITRQRCAQDGQKVSTFCCAPVVLKGSI